MAIQLARIKYAALNARQKENYNFAKISGLLADFGYVTMRLSDDWQGADFIAQHVDGGTFMKVQLKSRLTIAKKYEGKALYVAFADQSGWYLFPHDELEMKVLTETRVGSTESWMRHGAYSFPRVSQQMLALLEPYKIASKDR